MRDLYADIVKCVFERDWEKRPHARIDYIMDEPEFVSLLQEIAITVWHGDGRTASLGDIETRCKHAGLVSVLRAFENRVRSGIFRLLTAFYFREATSRSTERRFEFTHKSFGEYLVARKIAEFLLTEVTESNRDRDNDTLIDLVGSTAVTPYVLEFLRGELTHLPTEHLMLAHEFVIDCFEQLESVRDRSSPRAGRPTLFARNAQETLFVTAALLAGATNRRTSISWRTPAALGDFLARTCGQRIAAAPLCLRGLYKLEITDAVLTARDLIGADLRDVDAKSAVFDSALLDDAQCGQGTFVKSSFIKASLRDASFDGADLTGAAFQRVVGGSASFRTAELREVTLIGSDFRKARFVEADLTHTVMSDCLMGTADFGGATLTGVRARYVDFSSCNFRDAKLDDAVFEGCRFDGATFDGARFNQTMVVPFTETLERALTITQRSGIIMTAGEVDGALLPTAAEARAIGKARGGRARKSR